MDVRRKAAQESVHVVFVEFLQKPVHRRSIEFRRSPFDFLHKGSSPIYMGAAKEPRTFLSFIYSGGAAHEAKKGKAGDVNEGSDCLKRCGEGRLIGSIPDDERQYAEGHIHHQ